MSTRRRRLIAAAGLAAASIAVAAAGGASATTAAAPPSPSMAAAAENAFALSLLPRLAGAGNVVYSPYSIATALAMADAGARGRTAAQIAKTLGAPSVAAALADARVLRQTMAAAVHKGAGAPTLDVANALWTQTGLAIERPFISTLNADFGAPPYQVDFASAPQSARATINGWVSSHTAGIIPTVLPPGSVTQATRFVLANAIYLKALWQTAFQPSATHPRPFTTAAGRRVSVPFMSATNLVVPYGSGAAYQAVELPYRSSALSLLAILPVGETLPAFERTITARSLASMAASLRPRPVDLLMPKLHFHTATSLNATLEALGMTAAFGPSADFGAITRRARLNIGLVEHAADLRIDEQGTVAAAATVVVGPTAIALPQRQAVSVDLDRPFLLVLRENSSGAALFVAQVSDPGTG